MPTTPDNKDSGSLFVGTPKPTIGAWLLIAGEAGPRRISYVAGSDKNGWWAYFKGYGPVPVGRIEWEYVASEFESGAKAVGPRSASGQQLSRTTSPSDKAKPEPKNVRRENAGTAFDAYLMVDWSGSDKPTKPGKNSIWWSLHAWSPDQQLALLRLANPSTRSQAVREIRDKLVELSRKKLSVLVCFDFPYGFPAGTAGGISPTGRASSAWRRAWEQVTASIQDRDDNRSNRFEVAAKFNKLLSGEPSPFWGWDAGKGAPPAGLAATKPSRMPAGIGTFRLVDQRIHGPKSVFQLWGAGSVGSQALLGIPRLHALVHDRDLQQHSAVWPFTTGPSLPERAAGPRIVHAEIYPSFIEVTVKKGECKDEAQVQALGQVFAEADCTGRIKRLFEAPRGQPSSVLEEEGWILGVV